MPPTRNVSNAQPQPASHVPFSIPPDCHLLITTPSHILAWDSSGLHTIFTSSRHGIVAAREAKDGSGVIAIADKHVVVLHDTKRGQEQSMGLQAGEDEVRQLAYAQDARWLYLSTSLTPDVQRYSTEREKLMSPVNQAHHSVPIALAVSPTGHLIVSASDNPPIVYLKSLQHNAPPTLIQPRASDSAVCAAAFHPERPNLFLLGFRDGTLAAYDATHITRQPQGSFSNQEMVNDGELSHFTSLHRTTSKTMGETGITSRSASIAGAAFLFGYKTRAVSIGSDGRCRMVDFGEGGITLRSWHARAPLTSVSVTAVKSAAEKESKARKGSVTSDKFLIGGPTSTNNLIAVSRSDGKIHVYDSVGILLEEKTISSAPERVISVEWVRGPSPRPIVSQPTARESSDGNGIPLPHAGTGAGDAPKELDATPPTKLQRRASTRRRSLGLPPELRPVHRPEEKRTARPNRRFTIHPDEVEEGTVRHTPSPSKPAAVPVSASNYLDLFSPVKPPVPEKDERPQKRMTSPRPRPRISSKTFSSPLGHQATTIAGTAPHEPQEQNITTTTESYGTTTTTTGSDTATAPPMTASAMGKEKKKYVRRVSTHTSPLKKRHTTFKPISRYTVPQYYEGEPGPSTPAPAFPPNDNARVLADLRRMSKASMAAGVQGSVLAPFANTSRPSRPEETLDQISSAPPLQPTAAAPGALAVLPPEPVQEHLEHKSPSKRKMRHRARKGIGKQKYWHPGNVLERESTWPTDSVLDDFEDDEEGEDIWITDHEHHTPRPPARQTSRRLVDSRGTVSTTANNVPSARVGMVETVPEQVQRLRQQLDGSTTDEFYGTAASRLSPVARARGGVRWDDGEDGGEGEGEEAEDDFFTPSSADIRQLFPRASSLSPKRKKSPHKRSPRPGGGLRSALREVEGNSVLHRHAPGQGQAQQVDGRDERGRITSPWEKAKMAKTEKNAEKKGHHGLARQRWAGKLTHNDVVGASAAKSTARSPTVKEKCSECSATRARVRLLEEEVARLRAEVLGLKAVVRREGLGGQVAIMGTMGGGRVSRRHGVHRDRG
jgi:hypothetical protein